MILKLPVGFFNRQTSLDDDTIIKRAFGLNAKQLSHLVTQRNKNVTQMSKYSNKPPLLLATNLLSRNP